MFMFFIMIFGPEPEQNNTPRFTKTTIFPMMNIRPTENNFRHHENVIFFTVQKIKENLMNAGFW